MYYYVQVVKNAIDQICDVLEVHDSSEREEYSLYVITSSGAPSFDRQFSIVSIQGLLRIVDLL